MDRNRNIDLLKGFLIILVIVGHIIQAKLGDNLAKYLIYSFHMPLFIGISGYLVKYEKLKEYSFPKLINKYLFRVILPWSIAILAFMIVLRWNEIQDFKTFAGILIASFIKPYYHLWFISAFLSWIFISWVCARYNLNKREITIFAIIFSMAFVLLREIPWLLESYPFTNRISDLILHSFRPYYFVYFVFGMLMREGFRKIIPFKENIVLLSIGLFGLIVLFYYPDRFLEVSLTYVLNICLIYLALCTALKGQLPNFRILEWIGVNSLGIYLWHVMIIIILRSTIGTEDKMSFYLFAIICESVFLLVYAGISKIKLINLYVFGMKS